MKRSALSLALIAAIGLAGCNSAQQSNSASYESAVASEQSVSERFTQFSDQFIEDYWRQFPESSTWAGYGKYDHIITIPNAESMVSNMAFVESKLAQLRAFDLTKLAPKQKIDYYLIENALQSEAWYTKTFKDWQWNPSNYNVAGGFAQILNSRFKTDDEKLSLVLKRLQYVPDYYNAAQQNINNPTLEYTQLAIQQNQGAFSILNDELLKKVEQSNLSSDDQKLFMGRYSQAVEAIKNYISFLTALEQTLAKNGDARSFRIGEALYEEKFALNIQSGYTAKQMNQKALADKARVTAEMVKLTEQLWPKYFPNTAKPASDNEAIARLIKHLSVKHVAKDNFISEIKRQIPELETFVRKNNLVTLDPDKPLVVRETPEYMRGFAGASISSPGPYDKKENTYYNVTPLDNMDEEQAESYLREYNHWILQILNIHEAIPGHYVQLVYANESPSLIKSVFGNGAMIEGWAVYAERMMLEEGYGNFEPEMWLMYYKWNLRVICNTILDYGIHVNNMTQEEGLDLLMNGAFQERAEAEGKWRRATLSQVQLTSYYSGYREIYDFREAQKQKLGSDFDLKAFHEQFLSYGSAPVKYIRQLMK
ncbi:DUF885 domain-containing protein [Flocculibacter collagenilyticus]|uniref:DUF885 domain-containing protein n=1 Tax=Flocculibacter collagenilyticus TaxID=2744479 RepID=UPI0018F6C7B7|nr:DUF885 domain-containing protein [Flocculibacter collagenilyticus]